MDEIASEQVGADKDPCGADKEKPGRDPSRSFWKAVRDFFFKGWKFEPMVWDPKGGPMIGGRIKKNVD